MYVIPGKLKQYYSYLNQTIFAYLLKTAGEVSIIYINEGAIMTHINLYASKNK